MAPFHASHVPLDRTAGFPQRPLHFLACPALRAPFLPLRAPPRRPRASSARRGPGAARGKGVLAFPALRAPGPPRWASPPPPRVRLARLVTLAMLLAPRRPQTVPRVLRAHTTPRPGKRCWAASVAPWGAQARPRARWPPPRARPARPAPQQQTRAPRSAQLAPREPSLPRWAHWCVPSARWGATTAWLAAPPTRPALRAQRAPPRTARAPSSPSSAWRCRTRAARASSRADHCHPHQGLTACHLYALHRSPSLQMSLLLFRRRVRVAQLATLAFLPTARRVHRALCAPAPRRSRSTTLRR